MDKIKNVIISTNSQKVLDFFLDYLGKEFTEKETGKIVKISKSGINYALRELAKSGILFRQPRGKISFYLLNYKNPLVKQLKVLKTIIQLEPIVKKLTDFSSQITLFGSSARGENVKDSDIDLFIISNNRKEDLERKIKNLNLKQKTQLVVFTELGALELKTKDPDFYEQSQRGIILWKKEH